MKIELHIEELLLDGFDPRDRRRIADELQRALALAMTTTNRDFGHLAGQPDRLDAGSVILQNDSPAREVGTSVAGAIADALGGRAQ